MLLRPRVYLRSELSVPGFVRMRERAGQREEVMDTSTRSVERERLAMLVEHREAFLAFVKKRVRPEADAEDLLQSALVRAAEKLDGLRSDDRVDAWFYRVLRNSIADHHVAHARRENKLGEFAREASLTTHDAAEAAACACSLGVLDHLRADYTSIVKRVDLDEEPIRDVAASLGLTTNNAKVRLHRARRAMREGLMAICGTSSLRACNDCTCD